ncbi:hypothetical protein L6V77_22925 [Myxococcota bacterium]|nr:hypothetical protein [Myxococcota bacterium]
MTRFSGPARVLRRTIAAVPLLVAWAVAPAAAAPLDLAEPGPADAAAAEAALARFGKAFKARKLMEAETAARDAWAAGGGANALEALAVTALHEGRVPRAHQLYAAILADTGAPEDVRRRAMNQLAAMERQTGDLSIRGGAAGVPVSIDGDPVADLPPVVALRAMPGRRTVRIGAYETQVRFAAGRTTQVVVPDDTKAAAVVPAVVAPAAAVAVPAVAPPADLSSAGAALASAPDSAVDAALAARERARKARAAAARLKPERLRALVMNDPELKQALAALTDDQAILQQVAMAMQSGGGVEGIGQQLAGDPRVQRVLDRLKTLLWTETGLEEVF